MRVLVLDDDEIQLELVELELLSAGFDHITAHHLPSKAVSAAETSMEAFDVVLLDILMPDIDGIEACRRFRRTASTKDAKILMMTAMSERRYIDKAFAAGATDYIIKPFDGGDLKRRLSAETVQSVFGKADYVREFGPLFIGVDPGFAAHAEITHHSVLKTYLETLDRGRASISMATVFYVPGKQSEFLSMSSEEHIDIVARLAELIKTNLESTTFVLSYCGDATFVCFTRLGDPAISGTLARRIEAAAIEATGFKLGMWRGPSARSSRPQTAMDLVYEAINAVRQGESVKIKLPNRSQGISRIPDIFSN